MGHCVVLFFIPKFLGIYKVSICGSSLSSYSTLYITECIWPQLVSIFLKVKEVHFHYLLTRSPTHPFLLLHSSAHSPSTSFPSFHPSLTSIFCSQINRFPPDWPSLYIRDCGFSFPLLLLCLIIPHADFTAGLAIPKF